MTYQITSTYQNRTKVVKNAITTKVMAFSSREDAQAFADSMFANVRCDSKYQGRRLPRFDVVEG